MTSATIALPRLFSTDPEARRFRPDIQGLRAVAVLAVVLYHAGVPMLTGGFVGVDVFFVISGFLITQQLLRELASTDRISISRFYSRRFKRLLPPAFVVILTTLCFGRFVLPHDQLLSLTSDAFWAAVYGINYHLALEGINYQTAATPSPLQHFWSLAVEEQFYLVWPGLLLLAAMTVRRYRRQATITGLLSTIFAVSLTLSIVTTASNVSMAYFSLQTRAWELAAGGLLAMAAHHLRRAPEQLLRWLGWGGLSAIVLSALLYSDATAFPGWAALLPVLGSAAVIAGGMQPVHRSVETVLLDRRAMQYVGRTSYAWYLWHWPMLILLPIWLGRDLALWERLEVVFIAYWFAVLTYFIENAAHRSSWHHRRWLAAGAAMSGGIIAAASLVTLLMPSLQGTGSVATASTLRTADSSTVQQALARSFNITAVPANLTPTLSKAETDSPWEGDSQCFAPLARTTPKACVFGDPKGTKTAVLIGDSHADQWLNALEVGAKANGWRIISFTKAACPVADLRVWNNDLKRDYTECTTFRSDAWARIKELKPQLIIASEADAVGAATYGAHSWADATLAQMKVLAGPDTRLAYLGDSPYMPKDANGCLERNLDDARRCIYKVDQNPAWTDFYRTMRTTMQKAGVGYVDTHTFFCNQYVCPAVVDNMLTHRDQGHVTRTYADWLAPMLTPIFEKGSPS
ncbi:acyltransferase family protein [Branchiibius sp. NY16-3462-2]|uniref:acyltransferase family protein n=1 Tax=Branchiibius sp. NY16-3462-2 TaxID=1807500 RepID=UPI000791F051|nr:acyltransferase family protein [Branchiibius sp. NY16-3462-2]KYH44841.1 hypothetical protein AZH51_01530 [Branchiibius sp. NY16-3462-2]